MAEELSLDAKYRLERGRVFLSGIQALVRLPLDQHRADTRRGLDTATLICGYRGSPLGGFDVTLERNAALLREHQVLFISGVNEDLGATAVRSQLAHLFPKPKHDGVLGMWYGKAPGWTGAATSSSTPTSPGSAGTAASWRWPATTRRPSPRRSLTHSRSPSTTRSCRCLFPGTSRYLSISALGF
jgi:hypothetical protein